MIGVIVLITMAVYFPRATATAVILSAMVRHQRESMVPSILADFDPTAAERILNT